MAENDCPTCSGKGKVQILHKPEGRFAPLAAAEFIKCEDCGGTGERKR